jgi:hypothetical protein
MKNCPICHRDYPDMTQFCTRDGTKLQAAIAFKYCPSCSTRYPADITRCPEHNLDLVIHAKPANPEVSHCALCNKYYPSTIANCPVHGVALNISQPLEKNILAAANPEVAENRPEDGQASEFRFHPQAEAEPLGSSMPIAEPMESGAVSESDNNCAQSAAVSAAPLLNSPGSANTKELSPPVAITVDTLERYSNDSADRKLFVGLALAAMLVIASFAAYSLPRAFHRARAAEVAAAPEQNASEQNSSEQASSQQIASQQVSSDDDKAEDKEEIVQHITLNPEKTPENPPAQPKPVEPAREATRPPAAVKPSVSAKPAASAPTRVTSNRPSEHIATTPTRAPARVHSAENSPSAHQRANQGANQVAQAETDSHHSEPPASTRNNDGPGKDNGRQKNTDTGAMIAENDTASLPVKNRTAPARAQLPAPEDNTGSTVKLKSLNHQVAKISATITNKSRLQTANGYVYQFDLILRELTGLGIRWNSTKARKISYSGRSTQVDGLLGEQLEPHGTARYRMVIRMTGVSIEDWYGQIIYNCIGVDQNGNPVEMEQTLLLDNSFPIN